MKVAAWQALSTPFDIEDNLARLDIAARRAADEGAELLITPEMFLTGYVLGSRTRELAMQAPLEKAKAIAEKNGIGLVVGGAEFQNGNCYNAAHLIDETGQVLARYHKTHLFGELDRGQFDPGEKLTAVTEYRGVRIALLICYDVEFPESVRSAALEGAELMCVPTAQMVPFAHINRRLIPTRAWENQLFIVYANQHGSEAHLDYVGASVIVGPDSETLAEAETAGETLIYADINADVVRKAREDNPYLVDLRQELFSRSH